MEVSYTLHWLTVRWLKKLEVCLWLKKKLEDMSSTLYLSSLSAPDTPQHPCWLLFSFNYRTQGYTYCFLHIGGSNTCESF
jgi:hypothetical protein